MRPKRAKTPEERGEYIREQRDRMGVSNSELARQLGVSLSSLMSYQNGRRNPSMETMLEMKKLFELNSVEDIYMMEELEDGREESYEPGAGDCS